MISVVAPCFNEEKHLPVFLDSLVAQTFKDFEVIVVDGESTDRSHEILRSYLCKLKLIIITYPERNFGKIRNIGHKFTNNHIVFQCNTDNYFPPNLLKEIRELYWNPELMSLTGRVYPMGTSWIAYFAYPAFDLFRWLFTHLGKYRPSGSFTTYRTWVWDTVGGYPEVTVNEDGLFGQRIDEHGLKTDYKLSLKVGHFVKKFEEMGGIRALLFYLYVLGNHFPILKPFLDPVERKAGNVFSHQSESV